eukprot:TRINITY_DN1773_c0_g3_i1.p1 TRINITY_DN1773_c0_g3~~TRINITY_DN1773_c0_g3_i1.p1  ORF type:complete len:185 (+),score=51.31 TRINITY_DN1773_c0_g3_i1:594-1148(+)
MEKMVEDFEAQFIKNPRAVNDIIQLKAKNRMQDELISIQEKGLDYVHTIIAEKAKKPAKQEYTIFDSLEQDLKAKRNKGKLHVTLPRINYRTSIESTRTSSIKDSKIEELRNKFAASISKYVKEVNTLKTSINSIVKPNNDNVSLYDTFLNSLKSNKLDEVVQTVNERPELVNHVFSVIFCAQE